MWFFLKRLVGSKLTKDFRMNKVSKKILVFIGFLSIFSFCSEEIQAGSYASSSYFGEVPTLEDFAQHKEYQKYSPLRWISGGTALTSLGGGFLLPHVIQDQVLKDRLGAASMALTIISAAVWFGSVGFIKHGVNPETYSEMLTKRFANSFEASSVIGFNQASAEHMSLHDFNEHADQFVSLMEKVNFDIKCLKSLMFYFNMSEKSPAGFRVSSEELLKNTITKIDERLSILVSSLEQQLLCAGQASVSSTYSGYPVSVNDGSFAVNKGLIGLNLAMFESSYAGTQDENDLYLYSAKIHMDQLIGDLSKIKGLIVSIADSLEHVYSGRSWVKSFIGAARKVDFVLRLSTELVGMIVASPEYLKQCARKKELDAIAHEESMRNLERQKKAAEVSTMHAEAAKQEALAQNLQADAKKREAKARAQDVETAGKVIGGVLSLFEKKPSNDSDRSRA